MINNRLKLKIGMGFCLLLAAYGAQSEPYTQDDLAWLKKIVYAAHKTDYSGTFIYQSGNYVETSRITHLRDGENEHERLEGLDGERSEIIRKNDQVWCYLGDSKVMVAKRETTGSPTKLVLRPDRQEISADGEDVAFFTVEVQDAQGRIVPITDNDITFKVSGQGKILGTGNGDPTNHQPDTGSARKAFAGLCVAVVFRESDNGAYEIIVLMAGEQPEVAWPDPEKTHEARLKNRRVEITLIK